MYSELISLAEKDTSNVSSQGIPTTGTTRERHSQRNSGVLDAHDLSSHETPSTSFMNITPAGRRSQLNINGFQRSVLTKLETLIDKQEEALSILRGLLSAKKGVDEHEILEDFVPNPLDSVEELEELSSSHDEEKSRRKLLQFLVALCANTCANSVRRIMTKLGTNNLWSQYSLKGRKSKRPFQHLALCKVITKAFFKAHKGCSEANVEEQIAEFLNMLHASKVVPDLSARWSPTLSERSTNVGTTLRQRDFAGLEVLRTMIKDRTVYTLMTLENTRLLLSINPSTSYTTIANKTCCS
ncbi:uncharacterized protein LOC124449683 isoform X2 [Xenia sp. Carnegie-2017]|uniref:uncharacterized protein LOC124449683 isoform X2 n=1 Tax=Xenia sp. Carnegie-2017 TaxID=2897299 RepID=UPI001F03A0B1|nr:uncharacterized protein LOC124449683 isoform X2 [Xenia sp. Carnegie-2017]